MFSVVRSLLEHYKLVGFGYYRQAAPGAMQLADAIDVFYHSLLAIVASILALEVDDSNALSYLVATIALLLCLVHISFLSVKPIFKSLVEE